MIRKISLALSAALLLGTAASGAHAFPKLPNLVNQNFVDYTGSAPKGTFTSVNPVGWTGGNGLIFIDSQDFANSAAGPVYLTTYKNPFGSINGNYVEADGNPQFESGFNYEVTGLTPGQTYTLSFYQGASQQVGFTGTTTDQWVVSLATEGLSICNNCGPVDPVYGQTSTYYSNDPNASIATSQLMTVPTGESVGWEFVSVNLTADATSDLLSFLAWGDNGSTVNLPPIAFLSGVDSGPNMGVPEPAVWAMLGLGTFGLGGMLRRRRALHPAGEVTA